MIEFSAPDFATNDSRDGRSICISEDNIYSSVPEYPRYDNAYDDTIAFPCMIPLLSQYWLNWEDLIWDNTVIIPKKENTELEPRELSPIVIVFNDGSSAGYWVAISYGKRKYQFQRIGHDSQLLLFLGLEDSANQSDHHYKTGNRQSTESSKHCNRWFVNHSSYRKKC